MAKVLNFLPNIWAHSTITGLKHTKSWIMFKKIKEFEGLMHGQVEDYNLKNRKKPCTLQAATVLVQQRYLEQHQQGIKSVQFPSLCLRLIEEINNMQSGPRPLIPAVRLISTPQTGSPISHGSGPLNNQWQTQGRSPNPKQTVT